MTLSLIAAISRDLLIGTKDGLPWRLPADLRRFRKITLGKPVIVGRRTIEIIGNPLEGRHNVILSRKETLNCWAGCDIAHSMQAAFDLARDAAQRMGANEVMVIGGSTVYREAISACDRIYLTIVDGVFSGDAYFPSELPGGSWQKVLDEVYPKDSRNPHSHRYIVLERGNSPSMKRRSLRSLSV